MVRMHKNSKKGIFPRIRCAVVIAAVAWNATAQDEMSSEVVEMLEGRWEGEVQDPNKNYYPCRLHFYTEAGELHGVLGSNLLVYEFDSIRLEDDSFKVVIEATRFGKFVGEGVSLADNEIGFDYVLGNYGGGKGRINRVDESTVAVVEREDLAGTYTARSTVQPTGPRVDMEMQLSVDETIKGTVTIQSTNYDIVNASWRNNQLLIGCQSETGAHGLLMGTVREKGVVDVFWQLGPGSGRAEFKNPDAIVPLRREFARPREVMTGLLIAAIEMTKNQRNELIEAGQQTNGMRLVINGFAAFIGLESSDQTIKIDGQEINGFDDQLEAITGLAEKVKRGAVDRAELLVYRESEDRYILTEFIVEDLETEEGENSEVSVNMVPTSLTQGDRGIVTVHPRGAIIVENVERIVGEVMEDRRMKFNLHDDGVEPDVASDDGIWSLRIDVPHGAPTGNFTLELVGYTEDNKQLFAESIGFKILKK